MTERKKPKELTDLIREAIVPKYFKHGNSFYRIMEAEMGRTGHLYIEAELYNSKGEYKGMTSLRPLLTQFHFVEERDLPWYQPPVSV